MRKAKRTWVIIPFLLLSACAHQFMTENVPYGTNQSLSARRQGPNYLNAENDRFVVTESGLTNYRTEGRNYVLWKFAVRPKQVSQIQRIQVEDLSDRQPVLVVDDPAPLVNDATNDGVQWTQKSGLIRANSASVPWLFSDQTTSRVFRITIREANRPPTVLYQATRFIPKAKKAIRFQLGPEIGSS